MNHTSTPEIYTLSLHDALPISRAMERQSLSALCCGRAAIFALLLLTAHCSLLTAFAQPGVPQPKDRKSTRLNSSHTVISYAVFCLKKKKTNTNKTMTTYNDAIL